MLSLSIFENTPFVENVWRTIRKHCQDAQTRQQNERRSQYSNRSRQKRRKEDRISKVANQLLCWSALRILSAQQISNRQHLMSQTNCNEQHTATYQ